MNKIKIGIPKGLYYYKYKTLIINYLENLNIDIITGEDEKYELEENLNSLCEATKYFIRNAYFLDQKCDYILIPRIKSLKKNEYICPNYYIVYDILKDKLKTKILLFNIDYKKHEDEKYALITLGLNLGFTYSKCKYAYKVASNYEYQIHKKNLSIKNLQISDDKRKKILILGKIYNIQKIINKLDSNYLYLISEYINSNIDAIIYVYDTPCVNDMLKKDLIKIKTSKLVLEINANENIDLINKKIKETVI